MIYTLGAKEFKTKNAITAYFRNYLKTHDEGNTLSGEAYDIMADLIQWHPEYNANWGNNFSVGKSVYGDKNFIVNGETYSYLKCIKGGTSEQNHRFNVIRACRYAIKSQTIEYLDDNEVSENLYLCEISGECYPREQIHVDHNFNIITFQKIVENFLTELGISYVDITLLNEADSLCLVHLLDSPFHGLFTDYHRKNAKLRIIHKDYNLSGSESIPIPKKIVAKPIEVDIDDAELSD